MRCQCEIKSSNHSPGDCYNEGTIRVLRQREEILVCNKCTLSGDVRLDTIIKCTPGGRMIKEIIINANEVEILLEALSIAFLKTGARRYDKMRSQLMNRKAELVFGEEKVK